MKPTKSEYIAKAREWSRCLVAASSDERRAACIRARNINIYFARQIRDAEQGDAVAQWSLDASATLRRWGTTE